MSRQGRIRVTPIRKLKNSFYPSDNTSHHFTTFTELLIQVFLLQLVQSARPVTKLGFFANHVNVVLLRCPAIAGNSHYFPHDRRNRTTPRLAAQVRASLCNCGGDRFEKRIECLSCRRNYSGTVARSVGGGGQRRGFLPSFPCDWLTLALRYFDIKGSFNRPCLLGCKASSYKDFRGAWLLATKVSRWSTHVTCYWRQALDCGCSW